MRSPRAFTPLQTALRPLCTSRDEREHASPRTPHIVGLDGIRGIAVLLVLLFHFFIYRRVYPVEDPSWLKPAARLFNIGSSMGWIGVELFFVLSGFLITGILDDARGGSRYFSRFYSRRALRILPLYYAVLAMHLLVFSQMALPVWANIQYISDHQAPHDLQGELF